VELVFSTVDLPISSTGPLAAEHCLGFVMDSAKPLFDQLDWRDPLSRVPLVPVVAARAPSGVPIWGALKRVDTSIGYPIVDAVARMTPELAVRYAEWLAPLGLSPPSVSDLDHGPFQLVSTVDSFGFQWAWIGDMRTEADLQWRVASRFGVSSDHFSGRTVLDAGAGAGDQSVWLNRRGAAVVSIDLSTAIDVVATKLRMSPTWVGIQGDLTAIPVAAAQFDTVYCEGVIQHTRDSALAVKELCRVIRPGGEILATHYEAPTSLAGRAKLAYLTKIRRRLNRMEPHNLLLLTGNLAALAHIPVLGTLIVRSGLAIRYNLMPEFKITWTNTFDYFGSHAYQRHMTPTDFWACFEAAGNLEPVRVEGTVVRARRVS
jgi:SAM-dependent methyltransferase